MFEVQMHIPVADNAGRVFPAAHHAAFEAEADRVFGGFTRLPSYASGGWVNPAGVVFRDRTMVYAVRLGSIVFGGKVGELAAFAKAHYEQESIYVRYLGLSEIL